MTFGKFFMSLREKLKMSRLEFCAEHHLNPGNVYRIENGSAFFKDVRIINRYAEALKLKRESATYKKFVSLARTEYVGMKMRCMMDGFAPAEVKAAMHVFRYPIKPGEPLKRGRSKN